MAEEIREEIARAPNDAPPGDDSVLPFQLDALDLRGRVARVDRTLDRILNQHAYPPSVCALIGEAVLLAAMIGQAMKLRHRFSIQAKGEGAVRLIAADYAPAKTEGGAAEMRAYAQFAEDTPAQAADPYALLGGGLFAMTIDQGPHMQPYQGLTPLVAGGLSACAETYFAQSEQIATRFKTAIGQSSEPGGGSHWRAGGVMLQHLAEFGEGAQAAAAEAQGPSGEDGLMTAQDVADLADQSEAWNRANILLDTAEEMELIGPFVSPERLLVRLFHEETPRVYPAHSIDFGCSCRRERVAELLSSYPPQAVREMTTEAGDITADCQFCGAQYRFALDEVLNQDG